MRFCTLYGISYYQDEHIIGDCGTDADDMIITSWEFRSRDLYARETIILFEDAQGYILDVNCAQFFVTQRDKSSYYGNAKVLLCEGILVAMDQT